MQSSKQPNRHEIIEINDSMTFEESLQYLNEPDPFLDELSKFNRDCRKKITGSPTKLLANLSLKEKRPENFGALFFDLCSKESSSSSEEEGKEANIVPDVQQQQQQHERENEEADIVPEPEPQPKYVTEEVYRQLQEETRQLQQQTQEVKQQYATQLQEYKQETQDETNRRIQQMEERYQQQLNEMNEKIENQNRLFQQQQQQQEEEEEEEEIEVDELNEEVAIEKEPADTIICVIGTFNKEHVELGEFIESKGFVYSTTVTKETDYLIASPINHTGLQAKRAKQYKVHIRSARFLATLLNVDQKEI